MNRTKIMKKAVLKKGSIRAVAAISLRTRTSRKGGGNKRVSPILFSAPKDAARHTCAAAITRGTGQSSAEASPLASRTRTGDAVYRRHFLPCCTGTFPVACAIGASSSFVCYEAVLPVPPEP